jgi:REP element-mobilizing transposase RayT
MSGIIRDKKQKSIIVNGMPDHIHAFVGLTPSISIADLVRDVKNNSSNFINSRQLVAGKFSWQEGYGAFSYSESHIERVYNYIYDQEKHHESHSFKREYLDLLRKFKVPFNEKYLFEWIEEE